MRWNGNGPRAAGQSDVRESGRRLLGEREQVKGEAKTIELNLTKQIEPLRGDNQRQLEQLRTETKTIEVGLRRAIHRRIVWIVAAVGAVVGLIRVVNDILAQSSVGTHRIASTEPIPLNFPSMNFAFPRILWPQSLLHSNTHLGENNHSFGFGDGFDE